MGGFYTNASTMTPGFLLISCKAEAASLCARFLNTCPCTCTKYFDLVQSSIWSEPISVPGVVHTCRRRRPDRRCAPHTPPPERRARGSSSQTPRLPPWPGHMLHTTDRSPILQFTTVHHLDPSGQIDSWSDWSSWCSRVGGSRTTCII